MDLPSLIVFGPQTAWPSHEELSRLRTQLLNESYLRPLSKAVQQLPEFWSSLNNADPHLARVPGDRLLRRLKDWLIYDEPVPREDTTLNTLVTPMTVIIHSVQYLRYINSNKPACTYQSLVDSLESSGPQGFCTGFLTAAALACAKTEAEFGLFVAVSLRLAVCIGAYVDLDGPFASEPRTTCCLAVRWKPESGVPSLEEVLKPWPNAYVSVISDSEAATVTAPKPDAAALSAHFVAAGFSVKEIPLTGRFHVAHHQVSAEKLKKLCHATEDLQFPSAEDLALPLRSNIDGEVIRSGALSDIAIESLLCRRSEWHLTISKAIADLQNQDQALVLTAGLSDCLPRSTHRASNIKIKPLSIDSLLDKTIAVSSDAVAIVGMACRFPGADSLEEYWNIIESGKSMAREFPEDRFSPKSLLRHTGMKGPYWGNFMNDPAAFDHRFFKKSSREAVSMDPQQRILLQVAYEALEDSGYFGKSSAQDVGCYIGVGSVDYEDNVGSHQPTAFSALGTLRAFVSGKVSHHFGWKGPSVTYDTACSSSAVAIHSACRAIASGECSMALAGGVNVITSPNLYQNLGAASFLSPTGASRAFDAQADGYCRGEGVGAVVLKKLSSAIAEGDDILAVISGSAVGQNENCTPITVPHATSQAELYRKALERAGIRPEQVTYVEAHGTGTPVGDPIECSSIRQLFGGPHRSHMLYLGSVKGNIGHTEAASGVAALIKVVLMIQRGVIPRQANFKTLNPRIPPLHPDRMAVPTASLEWNANYKVACVNNYGAAGSNASLVVSQLDANHMGRRAHVPLDNYPIILTAHTTSSLQSRCKSIKDLVLHLKFQLPATQLLATISYTLAVKQNRTLGFTFATKTNGVEDLVEKLDRFAHGAVSPLATPQRKPVVLAFGGQTGKTATLSRKVYDSSPILKKHLDQCNKVFLSLTGKSLYPDIFVQTLTEQIVSQHGILFSVQYACAKTWLDCGLQVDAVVGHSFGQLTALCISGVLSLQDAMKFVFGRARFIEELWGEEKGIMLSVEADASTVSKLVSLSQTLSHGNAVEVACYNAANSHVLVGSEESIQALEEAIIERRSSSGAIKTRKLDVPRGFHSKFLDTLLPKLEALAAQLTFNAPSISLETCSEGQSWSIVTPRLVAEQSRKPVFFSEAVTRIQEKLGACHWLEAGSGTPIISMARRALGQSSISHTFQSIDLVGIKATAALVDSTVGLWNTGNNVHFWPFHGRPNLDMALCQLPPYQFEKTRHWLEFKENFDEGSEQTKAVAKEEPKMLSLLHTERTGRKTVTFSVDPQSKEFGLYVSGHAVLGKNLCPASLYIELAARAAELLVKKSVEDSTIPTVQDLEILSPLGIDANRVINLCLSPDEHNPRRWTFVLRSHPLTATSQVSKHATGSIEVREPSDTKLSAEFARYTRLIGLDRCQALLSSPGAQAMQGSVIYKLFGQVVDYSKHYRGVQTISSKQDEVAGIVSIVEQPDLPKTISDPIAVDNFIQVAGIHANIMKDKAEGEVLVCTKIEQIQPGPAFRRKEAVTGSWTVYASFAETTGKTMVNDIFVFDNASKTMVLTITGVHFTRVLTSSLSKVLSKVNVTTNTRSTASSGLEELTARTAKQNTHKANTSTFTKVKTQNAAPTPRGRSMELEVSTMLSDMADLDPKDITMHATLDDLGIDSLMITEFLSELRKRFSVELSSEELQNMRDIGAVCEYLKSKMGLVSPDLSFSDSESSTDVSSVSALEVPRTTKSRTNSYPSSTFLHAKLSRLVAGHLELDDISGDTKLFDAGLDSLLSMEVSGDIEKSFGVKVDPMSFTPDLTMECLARIVIIQEGRQEWDELCTPGTSPLTMTPQDFSDVPVPDTTINDDKPLGSPQLLLSSLAAECFSDVRGTYDHFAAETKFLGFRKNVYPRQAELVTAYVIEAFEKLGSSLASAKVGEILPSPSYNPKHSKVIQQYWRLLEEASLVERQESGIVRTSKAVPSAKAEVLHEQILRDFPQHHSEHKLLYVTASKLADCLRGTVDPIHLIFGNKDSKVLLEDVYTNAPMFSAGTKLLASFLAKLLANYAGSEKCRILELGAGTGGTTKHIVEQLALKGVPFTYTFSDLSPSLVAAAKRKFAGNSSMKYMVLDVEKAPPVEVLGQYDIVISTNCIHATRDLVNSTSHIREILKPDGILCLVELTRNLYWFDLVFGLLEGWWLFSDGRKHVLAEEGLWKKDLTTAGFAHVDWSVGESEESDQLRVIVGCASKPSNLEALPEVRPKQSLIQCYMESVIFKRTDGIALQADVYYPEDNDTVGRKRPIALMVHGGGHVMLSRKDVRPKQIQLLLEKGFLPVSIDYRLCPEVTLQDGPMVDARDALSWARHTLPTLKLQRADITPNGESIVAVGWSTGGTLAMSLAWTTLEQGIKPPEAVLAFYCPTDYEAEFWKRPNVPNGSEEAAQMEYDLFEGLNDQPITAYNVPRDKKATDGWLCASDPRSRIALHMNWKGQTLPVLINGLKKSDKGRVVDDMPISEQIALVSPLAQIRKGTYRTPTYLIHPTEDDLIPWQQSQTTYEALKANGVDTELSLVEGRKHLFDLSRNLDDEVWGIVDTGYEFLRSKVLSSNSL